MVAVDVVDVVDAVDAEDAVAVACWAGSAVDRMLVRTTMRTSACIGSRTGCGSSLFSFDRYMIRGAYAPV